MTNAATPAPTASALRDELRDHVGRTVRVCSICDPALGIYCIRAQELVEAFASMRAEEVYAERLRRAVEG